MRTVSNYNSYVPFTVFLLFLALTIIVVVTTTNLSCLFNSQIFDFPGFSLVSPESISKVCAFYFLFYKDGNFFSGFLSSICLL